MTGNKETIDQQSTFDFKGKITSIRRIVTRFERKLEGYIYSSSGNTIEFTGRALAHSDIIQKGVGLLQSFADESNLMTIKDHGTWIEQRYYNYMTFLSAMINHTSDNTENDRVVLQMFVDSLQNIGDIIMGSKGMMKDFVVGEAAKVGEGGF